MQLRAIQIGGLALLLGAAGARADQIVTATRTVDAVTIESVRDGAVVARTANRRQVSIPVGEATALRIEGESAFNRAEQQRAAKQWRAASEAYDEALRRMNDAGRRQLVLARSIQPLDASGRWGAAVRRFLELARTDPSAGTFTLQPTQLPAAGSKLLTDSAAELEAALAAAPFAGDATAARRLRGLLLGVYNQADDPRAAALARDLAPPAPPATAPTSADPALDGVAQAAELAVENGRYDDALRIAADALRTAEGVTAARLRLAQAGALEKQHKPGAAVVELLKVAVFEPDTPQAPQALLQAAELEMAQAHGAAARQLYERIVARYADSTEAGTARTWLAAKSK